MPKPTGRQRTGGGGNPGAEGSRPGLAPLGIGAAMRARDVSRPLPDEPPADRPERPSQDSPSGPTAPRPRPEA